MIECIPNFSEGRRREVIDAIAGTIAAVPGATVLDIHADADHNRSVITFAGEAAPVAEAAFQAVREAARLIDMTQHHGEHPRVGATDVLPFVPLRGATLEQCVALAQAVGRRVGDELGIPVYLYEAAATQPDRRNLPNLRRGEYEGLREAIERDPERAPDFGPARLGPAGATIVGARPPLIAYNIYLNTTDVSIAKRVARAVRGSSGGLRGVRALGLLVNGRAQVSMNLIDYRATPVHRAFDMVAREAAAYGATIVESELVGLIPEDALFDAARFALRLHGMRADQVLERRLAQLTADRRPPTTDDVVEGERGRAGERETASPLLPLSRSPLLPLSSPAIDTQKEQAMDTSWKLKAEALGTAACKLADDGAGAALPQIMLRALGRELLALAGRDQDGSARMAARTLLLLAERAVKVSELAVSIGAAGDAHHGPALVHAIHLALAVATDARLRAEPLLAQLPDEELRATFKQEFASHTRQAGELAKQART